MDKPFATASNATEPRFTPVGTGYNVSCDKYGGVGFTFQQGGKWWVAVPGEALRENPRFNRRYDAGNYLVCKAAERERAKTRPDSPDVAMLLNPNVGQ
jgi:hypothetical protein